MSFQQQQSSAPKAMPAASGLTRRSDSVGGLHHHRANSDVMMNPPALLVLDSPSSSSSMRNFGPSPVKKVHKAKNEDQQMVSRPRDPFVETEIQPGETLQSLALKYNVAAAELKRMNNIIGEREFFALKRIKIPVKPLSALAEQLQVQQQEEMDAAAATNGWLVEHFHTPPDVAGSPRLSDESEDSQSHFHDEDDLSPGRRGLQQQSKHIKKAKKLFRAVDKDLAMIKQRNDTIVSTVISGKEEPGGEDWGDFEEGDGELEETQQLLLLPSDHSVQVAKVSPKSKAMCLCCLALIVISVVIILWFAEYEFEVIEHVNRTNDELENHALHLKTGGEGSKD